MKNYDNLELLINSNNSKLLEKALNDYFHIIVRNVKNNIPKIIQYKLINYLEKNLFNNLIEQLHKNQEII